MIDNENAECIEFLDFEKILKFSQKIKNKSANFTEFDKINIEEKKKFNLDFFVVEQKLYELLGIVSFTTSDFNLYKHVLPQKIFTVDEEFTPRLQVFN
ncbi:hypothetical protein MHBO_000186 [Bonamia ostreae]|uniref:Uncharacterized protein n=1 Tax=Bonamia ostreae TaxID=126728 RepID=A0ABV2AER0_9EUKA